MQSLAQIKVLPSTYQGKARVLEWYAHPPVHTDLTDRLKKLNKLKASDELEADDVRQLSFDLESSLTEFHRVLAGS